MTDATVEDDITKSRMGDTTAFARVFQSSNGFAFRLAFRLLCDEDEAKDVVQESYIRVWRNLDHYDPQQKFTTWLYTIVSNLCLDRLRAKKRWMARIVRENPDRGIDGASIETLLEEGYANRELAEIIRGLTQMLPPKQRLVFTLRDLEDLSVEEVASITKMSAGTIKVNLHHARRAIRKKLERHHILEGT
jgi:RNA polymerase sigma-70 factor (ECF subfamily)